jgi:hypothetical protein
LGEEIDDDLQSIKEVIKEGSGSKGKRMAKSQKKRTWCSSSSCQYSQANQNTWVGAWGLKNISTSVL